MVLGMVDHCLVLSGSRTVDLMVPVLVRSSWDSTSDPTMEIAMDQTMASGMVGRYPALLESGMADSTESLTDCP